MKKILILLSIFYGSYTQSQIVYTDVNPDSIISAPLGDTKRYNLDLNNDGSFDFEFAHVNTSASWNDMEAFTYIGTYGELLVNFGQCPYSLNHGDEISSAQTIWHCTSSGSASSALFMYNNWLGVTDKYIGLRIKINNQWHYGWARFTVFGNRTGFVIKDYAYESTPDQAIFAGTTTSFNRKNITKNDLKIAVFNNVISILNTKQMKYIIQIYDTNGKFLESLDHNSDAQININHYANGIYILKIVTNNIVYTKKILK